MLLLIASLFSYPQFSGIVANGFDWISLSDVFVGVEFPEISISSTSVTGSRQKLNAVYSMSSSSSVNLIGGNSWSTMYVIEQ